MNTLTIKLKQHTPLIHFQHDQEDATLRASEVKPKLDKFILTKLTSEERIQGETEGWIKKKNDKAWLDYKMHIACPDVKSHVEIRVFEYRERTPLFFGNMKSDTPKGVSFCSEPLDLVITATEQIHKIIAKNINEFFFFNNFGTRQSKGYGSFYLAPIQPSNTNSLYSYKTPIINGVHSFSFSRKGIPFTASKNFSTLFQDIEYFYKTIRSGINQNGSYFKSLMYHYAKSEEKNEYWDKRAIRTHFELFSNSKWKRNNDLSGKALENKRELDQGEKRDHKVDKEKGCSPLGSEVKLYRDMLGLSSSQEWGSYGAVLNKKEDKEKPDIERFKSPILIKPLYDNKSNRYVIYIIPTPVPHDYLGKRFEISIKYKEGCSDKGRNLASTAIYTPSVFDVEKYLNYVFEGEGRDIAERQINAMPDKITRTNKQNNEKEEIDNPIKKSLKRIYNIK